MSYVILVLTCWSVTQGLAKKHACQIIGHLLEDEVCSIASMAVPPETTREPIAELTRIKQTLLAEVCCCMSIVCLDPFIPTRAAFLM